MTLSGRLDVAGAGLALVTLAGLSAAWTLGGATLTGFGLFANGVQVPLLALACIAAFLSARRLGSGSPARTAWLLLTGGLGVFLAAEMLDAWYEVVERTGRPFPSVADALFVCGYLFVIPAFALFIRVYRASGYEVGSVAEHAAIAAVGLVSSVVVGYAPLRAILHSEVNLAERVLGVTYPLFDFATLILALMLLRIAVAFRGGQIWAVWALLLLGFGFTCAADMMFAFLSAGGIAVQRPLMEACYVLSYLALARGAGYEYEMLAG